MEQNLLVFVQKFAYLLITFATIAIIVEVSLSQIFGSKLWIAFEKFIDKWGDYLDLKPWLTILICWIIVVELNIDILSSFGATTGLFPANSTDTTLLLTALLLAGGSKRFYKIFKTSMELKSKLANAKKGK